MNFQRLDLVRYILLAMLTSMFAFLLDGYVDLDYCEYDSCRFLRYSLSSAGLDQNLSFSSSGTQVMHWLYGETGFSMGFLYAALVNLLIFSFPLAFFGVRSDFVFFPLALCFMVLPGKEFFLVAALIYLFSGGAGEKPSETFSRILFFVVFVMVSRPAFLLIFVLAWFFWIYAGKAGALKTVFCCLATSFFIGAVLGYFSPPDADHSALQLESSIEAISIVRNLTFGFDAFGIWSRALIYFAYSLFLPALEMYRLSVDISAGVRSPSQFYGVCSIAAFALMYVRLGFSRYWRLCIFASFLIAATYPFLHTRYLLPVALFLYFCHQRVKARLEAW